MTRSELTTILFDLAQRKAITPEEMAEVLRRFDSGELDDLPVLTRDGERRSWVEDAALLFLLLGIPPVRTFARSERERARALLRKRFEATAATLAAKVERDKSVGDWHSSIVSELSTYTQQMAIAGAGTMPSRETQAAIEQRLSGQWPYLLAFGIQILARSVGERPMSPQWINQRSQTYGGSGWGAWFLGQAGNADYGYVERWETRDDRRVCPNCRPYHSQLFLPGQGPYPGWDCLGSCRCRRVRVYSPADYMRLGGV